MKRSEVTGSVILPLCKEFQYGKVNTETPCLVISTGYRYIDEKLLTVERFS